MALISVSNNALSNITALPASVPTGALTLIKSITASASASIEFINGTNGVVLDGTYSSYIFSFINIHPQTDGSTFRFNLSSDNGSNYNVVKTSTHFRTYHNEAGTDTSLAYSTAYDLAQSSDDHTLCNGTGGDNDQNISGYFQLFNPSSTTYVKHFIATLNQAQQSDYTIAHYVAGYANTTFAINGIKFVLPSGGIDDGTIKLYGVS